MNLSLESLLLNKKSETYTVPFEQTYLAQLESSLSVVEANGEFEQIYHYMKGCTVLKRLATMVEKRGTDSELISTYAETIASVVHISSDMTKEVALENINSVINDSDDKIWMTIGRAWDWSSTTALSAFSGLQKVYDGLINGAKRISNVSVEQLKISTENVSANDLVMSSDRLHEYVSAAAVLTLGLTIAPDALVQIDKKLTEYLDTYRDEENRPALAEALGSCLSDDTVTLVESVEFLRGIRKVSSCITNTDWYTLKDKMSPEMIKTWLGHAGAVIDKTIDLTSVDIKNDMSITRLDCDYNKLSESVIDIQIKPITYSASGYTPETITSFITTVKDCSEQLNLIINYRNSCAGIINSIREHIEQLKVVDVDTSMIDSFVSTYCNSDMMYLQTVYNLHDKISKTIHSVIGKIHSDNKTL